ncbi:uncharacterized protein [Triticum aestivum]|uniref:uncharacterized protein n=1 Tax=Triticum aestivum TaxID=4565 RepID=UPI001D027EDF|nr:uncharacterized protein LOC123155961 [Triticum aestivum]XP_044430060.1 uncharacterized protein LOC123155961 [Triticum aestivum]XP_044430061.1 uncharacterized protein LOC123155961 [Triticum aestivum]
MSETDVDAQGQRWPLPRRAITVYRALAALRRHPLPHPGRMNFKRCKEVGGRRNAGDLMKVTAAKIHSLLLLSSWEYLRRRGGEGGETPWQRPVANLRVSREGILAGVVASRGAWSTGRARALTLFVLPTLHTSQSGGGQQCRRRLCDGERSLIIAAPAVPRSHYIRVLMSNMTLRPSSLQEET